MQKVDSCADALKAAYTVTHVSGTRAKVCPQFGRKMLRGRYKLTWKANQE